MSSVIDVHAHLLMPELHAQVEEKAPEGCAEAKKLEFIRNGQESLEVSGAMISQRFDLLTKVEARLAAMDRQGIDTQWVSVSPNHFYPWADEELGVWVALEINRRIAEHVALAPDRLVGLGTIPLQHPHRAVECLDDAVLNRGLAGIEISSFAGSVELSDPVLDDLWARAEELGAVIFLHPFGCSLDERLNRFYLTNTVGQPVENAVALSHLIFSGVFDRFPRLKLVAAHGGGYLPTAIGRSDRAWAVRPEAQRCAHAPSSYLKNIWFDTVVHDSGALRELIRVAGASQVVLGTDFPFDMGLDDPLGFLTETNLTESEFELIAGATAQTLIAGIAEIQE